MRTGRSIRFHHLSLAPTEGFESVLRTGQPSCLNEFLISETLTVHMKVGGDIKVQLIVGSTLMLQHGSDWRSYSPCLCLVGLVTFNVCWEFHSEPAFIHQTHAIPREPAKATYAS